MHLEDSGGFVSGNLESEKVEIEFITLSHRRRLLAISGDRL